MDVYSAHFHRELHQLAHARLVNRSERIRLHDFQFGVGGQERAGIVAAHAEAGLRQIVRAEAEELGGLGNFVCRERAARDFDHRAEARAGLWIVHIDQLHDGQRGCFQINTFHLTGARQV